MFDMKLKLALLLSFFPVYALAAMDVCQPIGWATREGRTGGEFNVTGGGNAVPDTVRTFSDLQKYAKDLLRVSSILMGLSGMAGAVLLAAA